MFCEDVLKVFLRKKNNDKRIIIFNQNLDHLMAPAQRYLSKLMEVKTSVNFIKLPYPNPPLLQFYYLII